MRATLGADFLEHEGVVIGVNLGADACSEHEWGIKETRRAFGMDDNAMGIARYKTGELRQGYKLHFIKNKRTAVLTFDEHYRFDYLEKEGKLNTPKEVVDGEIKWQVESLYNKDLSRRKDVAAAWDDGSFQIVARAEHADRLEELYNALNSGNASIWLGGGGVFKNAGLMVCVFNKVPKEADETMRQSHQDAKDAAEFEAKTGIKELLQKAGKQYYALSIRKNDDVPEGYMWWLNPMDQENNHWGWVTLQDLKDWAENKGRIPNVKKSANG